MSSVAVQSNIAADQASVSNFFVAPKLDTELVNRRNPAEVHYIFNASHMNISVAGHGFEHLGRIIDPITKQPDKKSPSGIIPRGQIIPIFREGKWVADMHPTGTPGVAAVARGDEIIHNRMIYQMQEPGYIGAAIEREFGEHGVFVLWEQYSDRMITEMGAIANYLNFGEKTTADGIYANFKKIQNTNPVILARLHKEIAMLDDNTSTFPYPEVLRSVCTQIISRLDALHIIQEDILNQGKGDIQKQIIPSLDLRHVAIACVGGFHLADYEVQADASKVAVQGSMEAIAGAIAEAVTKLSSSLPAGGGTGAGVDMQAMMGLIATQQQMIANQQASLTAITDEMKVMREMMVKGQAKAAAATGSLADLVAKDEPEAEPEEEVLAPPPSSLAAIRERQPDGRFTPKK